LSSFLKEPQIDEFIKSKKTELLELGQHFKLAVNLPQMNGEIKKIVLAYLVDEEILPEEALERTSSVSCEQRLELKSRVSREGQSYAAKVERVGNKGKRVSA